MKQVGYVYILTNPSFKEDLVKIGITSGTVEKRMKELHTTGVPLPFEEYASYKTTKFKEVETFMHRSLSLIANNRVNDSREFFSIKPEVALGYLKEIRDLLEEFTKLFNRTYLVDLYTYAPLNNAEYKRK